MFSIFKPLTKDLCIVKESRGTAKAVLNMHVPCTQTKGGAMYVHMNLHWCSVNKLPKKLPLLNYKFLH